MVSVLVFWIFATFSAARAEPPPDASVETHAHLFMNEGMTWAFHGDFDEPLRAKTWTDRFSSQANPETVDTSGIHVLVATLYAHPLFTLDLRRAIRNQLDQAEHFVAKRPGWVIARTAAEARVAIAGGGKVMILGLEGASGIIENDADIAEFVDRRGIRIVTPLHFTDDRIGGAAFMGAILNFANPFSFLSQLLTAKRDPEGARLNARALKPEGLALVRKLIDHQVWIDLAHASDSSQAAMLPLLERAGSPLLYTHTMLRRYAGVERGISRPQLEAVARSRGIVGLMPSALMLKGTPVAGDPDCGRDGIEALVTQYREVSELIGAESIVMGSDWNGGVTHLSRGCGGTGTSIDREGYWNIAQAGELWRALRAKKAPVPVRVSVTVTKFLDAWARVTTR